MSANTKIYTNIPEEVLKALKAHEMAIITENEMVEGVQYELQAYTPTGMEMLHTVELGEGEESDLTAWRDVLEDLYDDFDTWKEAHRWLDANGNPYPETPYWNGLECYEDIKRYDEETLKATLDDLCDLVRAA